MGRLRRIPLAIVPDNGLFRIRGPAPPRDASPPAADGGVLLEHSSGHMTLRTLQGRIEVRVVLEEWDRQPPPRTAGTWEEDATADMLLPGQAVVDTDTARMPLAVRLLGGSRLYRAHVRAGQRHAVAASYDHLLRSCGPDHAGALRLARERLRGQERFLIQLWPID